MEKKEMPMKKKFMMEMMKKSANFRMTEGGKMRVSPSSLGKEVPAALKMTPDEAKNPKSWKRMMVDKFGKDIPAKKTGVKFPAGSKVTKEHLKNPANRWAYERTMEPTYETE